jgi:hypothetical protein
MTNRIVSWALLAWLCLGPRLAYAQSLGTDLAGLNLCLYGDCEARGAYAADPYGWVNPATLPVGTLPYVPRGAFVSGSYFRLNAGDVSADVESGTLTAAIAPFVLQANAVYAEASGQPRALPIDLSFRTRFIRLAAAVDLDRTALRVPGLSVGVLGSLPVTNSNLHLSANGLPLVLTTEDRHVDLTVGLHWRGGERNWFMAGAFVNAVSDPVATDAIDLATLQSVTSHGTTNAWFTRAGLSLLPFVPLGLVDGWAAGEWLAEVRLASDVALASITVPGEGTRQSETGYFGVDARILPDAWNPLSRHLRFYWIGGVDTDGGWGEGIGLYGNGPLDWLSCNPAYSSRPIATSLGHRVDVWSATCSASVPL